MLTGHEIEQLRRERWETLWRATRWPHVDGEMVVCLAWGVLLVAATVAGGMDILLGQM